MRPGIGIKAIILLCVLVAQIGLIFGGVSLLKARERMAEQKPMVSAIDQWVREQAGRDNIEECILK